ncbi:MAG: hypothetical protein FK730_03120 [Asgard group archaeon]|nr:hypothetical protein [Asgard group archaeon]
MARILGLDIGGANTKYAFLEYKNGKSKLIVSESVYFPIWKKHQELFKFLLNLKEKIQTNFGEIDSVAFVTTAELADCFRTKKEGIAAICQAVSDAFTDSNPLILDVIGNFLTTSDAPEKWLEVAATNWFASAALLGFKIPNAIIIDIGSTTTDFIPVFNHKVVANGKNDFERLALKELVYSGLLRTNVATIVHHLDVKSKEIPIASEYFATTGDIYYLIGDISEDEFTGETADGKPVTKANSLARLARVVCADLNQLTSIEIIEIAKQIKTKQIDILSKALKEVLQNYIDRFKIIPEMVLIGSGALTMGFDILKQLKIQNPIIADDVLNQECLNCYSAYAVAQLLVHKEYMMK